MKFYVACVFALLPVVGVASEAQTDLWQLHQEASSADPRILRAQAQIQSGEGRAREAFGQMLPQVSANSSFNRSTRDDEFSRDTYNGQRYALGISQAIYDPQVWRSYKKFEALAAQSTFEAEDARIQSSIDLAGRYFDVLAAEDELERTKAELQATERNKQQVDALFSRKMAMVTDVLELQARSDTLQANLIEAENQVLTAREAVSELVGRPVVEPFKRIAASPVFTLPAQQQDYWVDTALHNNPAISARQLQIKAAEAAVSEAKAGHLPRVGLNLTAQRSDIGYEGSLNPRTDSYVGSLDVQIPLYSGGSTSARVSSLYGDKEVAEQELEALRRQVERETRVAYLSLNSGISRIKATRQALDSASKSRVATEKAFGFGVKNAVDVLDSIQEEFRARRDLSQAYYKYITSLLVLHRWSGRLSDADIRAANDWLAEP